MFAAYEAIAIDRLVSLLAPDIYFEDPTFHLVARNREEMRPIYEPLGAAFRNVRITQLNRIAAAPWIVSQQRIAATILRADAESAINVQGLSLFEIQDGMIKRWYDYYDVLTFREQAGS